MDAKIKLTLSVQQLGELIELLKRESDDALASGLDSNAATKCVREAAQDYIDRLSSDAKDVSDSE